MFGHGLDSGSICAGGSLLSLGFWSLGWILLFLISREKRCVCLSFYIKLRVKTKTWASILRTARWAHPLTTPELYTHNSCFMMRLHPGAYTPPASLCMSDPGCLWGPLHNQSFRGQVKHSHLSCLALGIYSYNLAHSHWGHILLREGFLRLYIRRSALIDDRDHAESGC